MAHVHVTSHLSGAGCWLVVRCVSGPALLLGHHEPPATDKALLEHAHLVHDGTFGTCIIPLSNEIVVQLLIGVKYLFQFQFWQFNKPSPICSNTPLPSSCISFAFILGIIRSATPVGFMSFLVPDILLLFSLFVHKASCIYHGMWEYVLLRCVTCHLLTLYPSVTAAARWKSCTRPVTLLI